MCPLMDFFEHTFFNPDKSIRGHNTRVVEFLENIQSFNFLQADYAQTKCISVRTYLIDFGFICELTENVNAHIIQNMIDFLKALLHLLSPDVSSTPPEGSRDEPS